MPQDPYKLIFPPPKPGPLYKSKLRLRPENTELSLNPLFLCFLLPNRKYKNTEPGVQTSSFESQYFFSLSSAFLSLLPFLICPSEMIPAKGGKD